MGVGVETEFLIRPRRPFEHPSHSLRDFSVSIAKDYNHYIERTGQSHPTMHNAIGERSVREKFAQWSLDSDSTIDVTNTDGPPSAPLEIMSPMLRAYPGSAWRSHITALWDYLEQQYFVSANMSCGTHVHIAIRGGYNLEILKNIARSIIHFEPAFEVLIPRGRRGNMFARSNWIDNPNFEYGRLSRPQAMAMIREQPTAQDLILLMNPDHDKMFGWNFLRLLKSPHATIEFRRGSASTRAGDVFKWIELAMSFIAAAIQVGKEGNLVKTPRNLRGLRYFLEKAALDRSPGMHDHRFIEHLFHGKDLDISPSPTPRGPLSSAMKAKLKEKREEDIRKDTIVSKVLNKPHWG